MYYFHIDKKRLIRHQSKRNLLQIVTDYLLCFWLYGHKLDFISGFAHDSFKAIEAVP